MILQHSTIYHIYPSIHLSINEQMLRTTAQTSEHLPSVSSCHPSRGLVFESCDCVGGFLRFLSIRYDIKKEIKGLAVRQFFGLHFFDYTSLTSKMQTQKI